MRAVLRKLVLLGLSTAVIVVVAVIYSRFAGTNGTASSRDEKLPFKSPNSFEPIKRIGRGGTSLDRGEKIDSYDLGVGGRIEREYHIKRFKLLESEDQASLEDVTLVWYLKGGQTLTVTSQSGQVYIEHGALGSIRPTSGVLTGNVRIEYDTRPADRRPRRPLGQGEAEKLVITTDSLDFDTRSSSVSTDRPVQLRGAGIDAQGTGLLLRWRQISRDIDTLTILHGGQLIWLPGQGRGFATVMAPEEPKPQTTATIPVETPKQQLAPEDVHTYLASFRDNVRVTFKDQVLDNVNTLNITFDMRPRDEPDSPEQGPESSPDADTSATSPPAAEPDDTDLQDPLLLIWTGELTIVPSEKEKEDYQPAAQRRFEVEALGAPVKFHSSDMSGSCARLYAEHHSGIVRLYGNPDFDVLFEATDGSTVVSDQVHIRSIDAITSTVQMIGKGSLKSTGQTPDKPSKDSQGLHLTWQSGAELTFHKYDRPAAASSQDYYLSEATARDRVVAVSDELSAWADKMHIELGAPGSDGTDRGRVGPRPTRARGRGD